MSAQPKYLNREIGLLRFNHRVFQLAQDKRIPLLERVFYLNIFHSNMDEFFMKRVGGIKHKLFIDWQEKTVDGLNYQDQLDLINQEVNALNTEVDDFTSDVIIPDLETIGIQLLLWDNLKSEEKSWCTDFFEKKVFPILTPLAVDQGHPFPLISNLSYSIAVSLRAHPDDDLQFARVKIPPIIPLWVKLETEGSSTKFVSLRDIIINHLQYLFQNMIIENVMSFRLTRNIDIEASEEDADDLLELISNELKQRKFAQVVRLEHGPNPDPWLLNFLVNELEISDKDIYSVSEFLEYRDLSAIAKLSIPEEKFSPWVPQNAPLLNDESHNIFQLIKRNDVLVHHPFHSFTTSVERFLDEAANDPSVVAIKLTIYRTSEKSIIVDNLIRAAERGKHVVCVIELKARMDEERNIYWAQKLEKAGVHVVYGIVGLKIHAKAIMVVREEADNFVHYCHIGTGNYNSSTARTYTDMGLFTTNEKITRDLFQLFHYFTGRSRKVDYEKLLVAPINLKRRFLSLVEREIKAAKAGKPAHIIVKINSFEDNDVINSFYEASQAGVKIDLYIRGFCCLNPGVKGLSENIQVFSVLGQFLEHSRIFYFRNGKTDPLKGDFYIGSADLMFRSLKNRVEAVTPIEDEVSCRKIWRLLCLLQQNYCYTWQQQPGGQYKPIVNEKDPNLPLHTVLMEQTKNVEHLD